MKKPPPFGFAAQRARTTQVFFDDTDRLAAIRRGALTIVKSNGFELAMMGVVIFDATVIAVEQSLRVAQRDVAALNILQNIIMVIYIVEIILRLVSGGRRVLTQFSIQFDLILVLVATLSDWIMPLLEENTSAKLRIVVSIARLARPARCIRVVIKEPKLWMLVRGFVGSAINTIPYTMLLLTITIHIFASIGLELITLRYKFLADIPEDIGDIVNEFFGDRGSTMLTLLQFVCMDSIGTVYRPLIQHDWVLAFYFVGVIAVVAIILMDVITAIIVHAALEQSNNDREAMRERQEEFKIRLTSSVKAMFHRLDQNDDGKIDLQEILNVSGTDLALLNEYMAFADPIEVFDILDVDKSGTLDVTELCDGLFQSAASKSPVELKRIDKQVSAILANLTYMQQTVDAMRQHVGLGEKKRSANGIVKVAPKRNTDALERQWSPSSFDQVADSALHESFSEHGLDLDAEGETTAPRSQKYTCDDSPGPVQPPLASTLSPETVLRCSDMSSPQSMPADTPAWALEMARDIRQLRHESRYICDALRVPKLPAETDSPPAAAPSRGARGEATSGGWVHTPSPFSNGAPRENGHHVRPQGVARAAGGSGGGSSPAASEDSIHCGGLWGVQHHEGCDPHEERFTVESMKVGASNVVQPSGLPMPNGTGMQCSAPGSSLARAPPRMYQGEPPPSWTGLEAAGIGKALVGLPIAASGLEGVVLDV